MRLFRAVKKDRDRPVQRVLVMLDYGPEDPASGEVFDVTALANELATNDAKHHHARVALNITAKRDFRADRVNGDRPIKARAAWDVMVAFDSSGETGWLDDAVNASIPITERNEDVLKKIRRTEQKLEQLREVLKCQRLDDAERIRSKYPLARITDAPVAALAQSEPNV